MTGPATAKFLIPGPATAKFLIPGVVMDETSYCRSSFYLHYITCGTKNLCGYVPTGFWLWRWMPPQCQHLQLKKIYPLKNISPKLPPVSGSTRLPLALSISTVSGASSNTTMKQVHQYCQSLMYRCAGMSFFQSHSQWFIPIPDPRFNLVLFPFPAVIPIPSRSHSRTTSSISIR